MADPERRAEDYYHGHHKWNRWIDKRISVGSMVFAIVLVIGYYVDQEAERRQVKENAQFIEAHTEDFDALEDRAVRLENRQDQFADNLTTIATRIGRVEDRNSEQYQEIIRRLESQQQRSDEILSRLISEERK